MPAETVNSASRLDVIEFPFVGLLSDRPGDAIDRIGQEPDNPFRLPVLIRTDDDQIVEIELTRRRDQIVTGILHERIARREYPPQIDAALHAEPDRQPE